MKPVLKVEPVCGLRTTEGRRRGEVGGESHSEPTANVMAGDASGDETEGSVSPAELTFVPDDWVSAQIVSGKRRGRGRG